jgi:predicted lipid-binding transport protein (Tim44 family)
MHTRDYLIYKNAPRPLKGASAFGCYFMDATTLIFGLLAVFVVWKLRSVLGTRTGHEQPPVDMYRRRPAEPANDEGPNSQVRGATHDATTLEPSPDDRRAAWLRHPGIEQNVLPGLESIVAADKSFDPKEFIEGAKAAYEMIIMSFAAGNRAALRDLLAKDVYESFVAAIADRESRGDTVDTTFVSIDRAMIDDAQLRGNSAQVTMRFQSKLITATRSSDGRIVDGNPDKVVDMIDVWTFARETSSRDPNWRLVATEVGA